MDEKSTSGAPLRNEVTLIPSSSPESGFSGPIQRVSAHPIRDAIWESNQRFPRGNDPIDAYSAAADKEGVTATNDGFRFAADIMKSQMRGTKLD